MVSRLRLKGNLSVDPGFGDIVTTGELAAGVTERYLPDVRLFASEVPTNLGILHEAGHQEPWIIAMNCLPTKAAVRDYGSRWGIEPLFSDFKSRGFDLETTPLRAPDLLDRLLLIMALAMHGCVRAGQEDARHHPTPLEKKTQEQTDPDPWTFKKTRPQRLVLVQARSAVAPETAPNATTLAVLLSCLHGHEELIGGKLLAVKS